MGADSYIKIKGLSKGFHHIPVLNELNLEIRKGEIFGIVGESGSGKSTFLNLLVGLTIPDAGDIGIRVKRKQKKDKKHKAKHKQPEKNDHKNQEAADLKQILDEISKLNMRITALEETVHQPDVKQEIASIKTGISSTKSTLSAKGSDAKQDDNMHYVSIYKKLDKIRKIFGYSPQEHSFYDKLTVKENIDYFGEMYNVPSKVRLQNMKTLVTFLGLKDVRNTLACDLSGGMQKRLDIACALIHNPKVLILDEPTSDLDPILRQELHSILKQIRTSGTTIIITSHILGEVELLCDRVAILDKGRVIYVEKPSEIVKQLGVKYEISFKNHSGKYGHYPFEHAHIENGTLLIFTSSPDSVMDKIIKRAKKHKDRIESIEIHKPNLNSAFRMIKNGKDNKDNK